ncbi:hypothetical protein CBM2586_A120079 [Cupriavidus phytorum]|uniref:Uncharacterized protein n=3 Tax=Cupriavidus TaxID=106589 RepID=A0A375C160_9BURK|nr:hypothetical protein CBM2586_A120079 [Cupriavidus taiwanensis]
MVNNFCQPFCQPDCTSHGARPGCVCAERNAALPMLIHMIAAFAAFGVLPLANAAVAYVFELDAQRQNVSISGKAGVLRACRFPRQVELANASFDGSALIVSATEYVPVRALLLCDRNPVDLRRIPSSAGSLVDVNIEHGLYLTVDVVSASPLSFLVTVARIGSSRNIMNIPGAYHSTLPLTKLQEYGFSYDESRARGKVSPDGNYVAPNGEIDCSAHAYPGVWDIKTVACASRKA